MRTRSGRRFRSRPAALLLTLAGAFLLAALPAGAQVPHWVTGKKEVASEYKDFIGSRMNFLLLFVSTIPSDVPDGLGEYPDPWVRVYALKDYVDMARLLQQYPEIRYTIAISPAVLDEIQGMVTSYDSWIQAGRPGGPIAGWDRWLRLSATPVKSLTPEQKLFIAENFFRVPVRDATQDHTGFRELSEKRHHARGGSPQAMVEALGDQGLLDLVVWFNLAIFDPDFLDGRVDLPGGVSVNLLPLVQKGKNFTEQDREAVLDAQFKVLRSLVPLYRAMQEAGQLEVATIPYDDPVLPLLLDPKLVSDTSPDLTFPAPSQGLAADAGTQIEKSLAAQKRYFGNEHPGIWLGAGGAELPVVDILKQDGFAWGAADDNALRATTRPERIRIGERRRFSVYQIPTKKGDFDFFFEDIEMNKNFAQNYGSQDGLKAANMLLTKLRQQQRLQTDQAGGFMCSMILPLETTWDSFPNDGKRFLHSFLSQVSESPWLNPVTPSAFFAEMTTRADGGSLSATVPATGLYGRWIGTKEQQVAWKALADARKSLESPQVTGDARAAAMRWMLRAEGRDLLGGLAASASDAALADGRFRDLLRRSYRAAGLAVPGMLDQPLGDGATTVGSR